MHYFCCDERRRDAVRRHHTLNGIDFLDVLDGPDVPRDFRQTTLLVHFIKPLQKRLTRRNVLIEGGERIQDVTVTSTTGTDTPSNVLTVRVNKPGDFSLYTLRLLQDTTGTIPSAGESPTLLSEDGTRASNLRPPAEFDPLLSVVNFSFKTGYDNDSDCQDGNVCPPELHPEPEIDYLAKDYNSFRQLMLDRMTAVIPDWKERSAADVGIAMVEVLAYVGDYLSYQQDVIATEAFLGTARRRASVRRHAQLLDYYMHDGSNARVWVQVYVRDSPATEGDNEDRLYSDSPALPKGAQLLTRLPGYESRIVPGSANYTSALLLQPEVFETMYDVDALHSAHNELRFYTWGARECCLPKGATRATLQGNLPSLKEGSVLILEEILGPRTGRPYDADPTHRWAVRLTRVTYAKDPLGAMFTQSNSDNIIQNDEPAGKNEITETELEIEVVRQEDDEDTVKLPVIEMEEEDTEKVDDTIIDTDITLVSVKDTEIIDIDVDIVDIKEEDRPDDTDYSVDVTEIEWHIEDALPFPLTISSLTDFEHGQQYIEDVSIALGNIVLADHGRSIDSELLGTVPPLTLFRVSSQNNDRCTEVQPSPVPPRFRPRLQDGPLTHAAPYDPDNPPASASAVMSWTTQDPQLLPVITLDSTEGDGQFQRIATHSPAITWHPQRDLLNSGPTNAQFVVESEADGSTYLRFGDGQHGAHPASCSTFTASYRVGNGVQGNVGAETLAHIVSDNPSITGVYNPLAALGGVDPETIEDVRQQAPGSLHFQMRAVTPGDYIEVAERNPEVRQATAIIRWTGAWPTVYLNVERPGRAPVDPAFTEKMRRYMEQFRLGGYDMVIKGPRYVSLDVKMIVVVKPDYFRGDIKAVLLDVFSNRVLPDGGLGLFHPDNFAFGQPVYTSLLYTAALAVEGVDSVQIIKFQRQDRPDPQPLLEGELKLERVEIARLDNDPNFPEHGVFRLELESGK